MIKTHISKLNRQEIHQLKRLSFRYGELRSAIDLLKLDPLIEHEIRIYKKDEKIVGWCLNYVDCDNNHSGRYLWCGTYVNKKFRNQGIGFKLLEPTFNYAQKLKLKVWMSQDGEDFYKYKNKER